MSDLLRMLVGGSPLTRTLEAVAAMATSIRRDTGCSILLINDDVLVPAAAHGLSENNRTALAEACRLPADGCLAALRALPNTELHQLVTAAAELVGVVVVFSHCDAAPDGTLAPLDEVCSIATLAVEAKHVSDELAYRANFDSLTGLWNRSRMADEISLVLEAAAESGSSTGLVHVAIDSFRTINELLGSQIGNQLLREVAGRLARLLRPKWSIARFGGDEFLLLLPEVRSADQVRHFAQELLYVFDVPFGLYEHELLVRATVGTSFSRAGECRPDDLQSWAETALRHGKRMARSRVSAYRPGMTSNTQERLRMEQHLRYALHKGELELHYQPQMHLASGRVTGVEALLRWFHPSLGYISPASFIPIAEQIGIIGEIGDWVLRQAVRQLEHWHSAGVRGLRVAVNVSALQFGKDDFAASVARCLRGASIRPCDLELEITETALMSDFEHGVRQIKLLREQGVLTALDDFGTGHSSLAYLQQLPIHRLKIDRMFVKDIVSASELPPLLATIIQMGRALGCAVLAEGIETAEQALAVSALQCEEAQGFFLSRPLPPDKLLEWVLEWEKSGGEGPIVERMAVPQ